MITENLKYYFLWVHSPHSCIISLLHFYLLIYLFFVIYHSLFILFSSNHYLHIYRKLRRKFQFTVQGRFLRSIPFSSIYTGQVRIILVYCLMLYCFIFYYIVLYCIVLYCIILYYIVLYCIVLYCIVLYFTLLYCIVLYCIVFYWFVLYCIL